MGQTVTWKDYTERTWNKVTVVVVVLEVVAVAVAIAVAVAVAVAAALAVAVAVSVAVAVVVNSNILPYLHDRHILQYCKSIFKLKVTKRSYSIILKLN